MPTYTYHCPANGRSVDVLHGMSTTLRTWGEVCEADGQDPGTTAASSAVEKLLGAGMVLTNARAGLNDCQSDGPAGPTGGCCGGGCGRPD